MSKFFAYLRTREFRKNFLVAIVSLVSLLLIAFFSLRFYTNHGEALPVPELKGLMLEEAIQVLESEGFQYQVDSVYQADKKPGAVVEQDPDAGTRVKRNRVIYLTVITRTAPDVGFPDILNKTFLEVQAIITNYGLKVGDTSYVSDIERDRVLEAKFGGVTVKPGQEIPKGSRIDLVLGDGQGASEVDLPDLTGLTISEALFMLKGASLDLGDRVYEGSVLDSAKAKIIKQYPAVSDSLTKVSIGTKIDVVLSNQ
ncbi:PASTA domain-containing protein [Hufsiella ginkgonis]|uniref:PASTA domain-containing protein n=1 Tax=Hufsiella ginkgonis TaxID=2695274 RepID=A0A7K1Y024_9SPHI|nr:PASTA domain-containing protein [Hufsiella ginkgonis]MXV16570.1 PASTA domain-containing protein [Hufsiella ginkgonis]